MHKPQNTSDIDDKYAYLINIQFRHVLYRWSKDHLYRPLFVNIQLSKIYIDTRLAA